MCHATELVKIYLNSITLTISMICALKVTQIKGFEPKVRSPEVLNLATKHLRLKRLTIFYCFQVQGETLLLALLIAKLQERLG